jgi:hypothetical protein
MQRLLGLAVVSAAVVAVAGCGSLPPQSSAAARVAEQFRAAMQRSDGSAACRLLAPDTASAVVQSTGKPCPEGIVTVEVGGTGRPTEVDAYGQNAWVVFPDDTVFLANFPAGWRLTAAGCTPRGDRPYNCLVKGG